MAPRRKKQRTGGADAGVPPGAHSVGVDVAEAVGRLLISPPDVLNNIQTACRDVAAFACVCKACSIVAKETLWRLVGEQYPATPGMEMINGDAAYDEEYLMDEITIRRLFERAIKLEDVPQYVPRQVAAEFARLRPLCTAATNARRFFCLTDRELQQLPSVAMNGGAGRLFRLQHLVAAARAKHGTAAAFWELRGARAPLPLKPLPAAFRYHHGASDCDSDGYSDYYDDSYDSDGPHSGDEEWYGDMYFDACPCCGGFH